MPGLGKYGTTEDRTSSQERRERRQRQFQNSPIYDGSYGHEQLIEIANQVMLEHDESSPDLDFNYTNTPSWSDVEEIVKEKNGAGGYPTTPWTPNQASPGEKPGEINTDPNTIPEYIVEPTDIKDTFVVGVDGTVDPKKTAKDISSTRLGETLTKGSRPVAK